jgi:hypothetical protein
LYYTTGLSREQITDLCVAIHRRVADGKKPNWPPKLGLFKCVVVTLTYLRRNRVQQELAETYDVSQSTIGRAVTAITPELGEMLAGHVPTADELDDRTQFIVDGTLLPCWSWASHPQLYSGKHKTTGMNVQVACTLSGRLVWISDPIDGSRHDTYCLTESGVLLTLDPCNWVGDKRGERQPLLDEHVAVPLRGEPAGTRPHVGVQVAGVHPAAGSERLGHLVVALAAVARP